MTDWRRGFWAGWMMLWTLHTIDVLAFYPNAETLPRWAFGVGAVLGVLLTAYEFGRRPKQ